MKGLFDKKRQGRGRHPKEGGLTREIAGIIIGLGVGNRGALLGAQYGISGALLCDEQRKCTAVRIYYD